jgi:integrase-like protein
MTKEQAMSPLRARMIEDMKLAGLAATTQEIYLQAVRSLAKHYNRLPELLAEEEVRRYLLDVRERNARGSFKTCHYGIQFFYRNTLAKDWGLFKKRSGCPSKSGSHRPFLMPRSGAFSTACATRYTEAASA